MWYSKNKQNVFGMVFCNCEQNDPDPESLQATSSRQRQLRLCFHLCLFVCQSVSQSACVYTKCYKRICTKFVDWVGVIVHDPASRSFLQDSYIRPTTPISTVNDKQSTVLSQCLHSLTRGGFLVVVIVVVVVFAAAIITATSTFDY